MNSTSNSGFTALQLYTYDSLNRLGQATEVIGAGVSWQQTFSYNRFGNRTFNEAGTTTLPKNCSGAVCTADRKVFNPSVSAANNSINPDQDGDSGFPFNRGGAR